jgi:hypothetical protein
MKIVKTILTPITSDSTGTASAPYLAMAIDNDWETIQAQLLRATTFTRVPSRSLPLPQDVLDHINLVIKVLLLQLLATEGYFKWSTAHKCTAFIYDMSYSQNDPKDLDRADKAELRFQREDGTHVDIYLHYKAIFPNGQETTYRINQMESSTWLNYISQY